MWKELRHDRRDAAEVSRPHGAAKMYCAGSPRDVVVVFEAGAGTEPTNCCLGDGVLYVTLPGPGRLGTLAISAEPLALYPARR